MTERALRKAHEAMTLARSAYDLALASSGKVDAVSKTIGEPPNPLAGFAGTGLQLTVDKLRVAVEDLAEAIKKDEEAKKSRAEWTKWAVRVAVAGVIALLLGATATFLSSLRPIAQMPREIPQQGTH